MLDTSEPFCNAVIFSDAIIRDSATNKLSLINCFTGFNATTFPFFTPHFNVTVTFTNITGTPNSGEKLHLTARVEVDESGQVLASSSGSIEFNEKSSSIQRDHTFEIPFPIKTFEIKSAGKYVVKILLKRKGSVL